MFWYQNIYKTIYVRALNNIKHNRNGKDCNILMKCKHREKLPWKCLCFLISLKSSFTHKSSDMHEGPTYSRAFTTMTRDWSVELPIKNREAHMHTRELAELWYRLSMHHFCFNFPCYDWYFMFFYYFFNTTSMSNLKQVWKVLRKSMCAFQEQPITTFPPTPSHTCIEMDRCTKVKSTFHLMLKCTTEDLLSYDWIKKMNIIFQGLSDKPPGSPHGEERRAYKSNK